MKFNKKTGLITFIPKGTKFEIALFDGNIRVYDIFDDLTISPDETLKHALNSHARIINA